MSEDKIANNGRRLACAAISRTTVFGRAKMLENVIKVGRLFIEWKFVASSLEKNRPGQGQLARGRYRLAEFDNKDFIPLLADPPPPANAMS